MKSSSEILNKHEYSDKVQNDMISKILNKELKNIQSTNNSIFQKY